MPDLLAGWPPAWPAPAPARPVEPQPALRVLQGDAIPDAEPDLDETPPGLDRLDTRDKETAG